MLEEDDLKAAVAAGIVTEAQAATLLAFAANRERERAAELGHEERFRFMRGFNDFFFAVGIVLFGSGLVFFAGTLAITNLIAAVITWALAELLVRRLRLVLPGILLACFFAFFVFMAIQVDWDFLGQQLGLSWWRLPARDPQTHTWLGLVDPATIALRTFLTTMAVALFYARFRLPFALLLIAGGLVVVAQVTLGYLLFGDSTIVRSLIYLGCGIAVFAAAMAFDMSDRERLTRRADCAFWLHLLAAPLIVHSLIEMVLLRVPASARAGLDMPTDAAAAIAAIVAVLTLIAIIIDRRALLVSALTYLGVVIGSALSGAFGAAPADRPMVFFATLLILGVMVLTLGVGWMPLRRRLIALLSSGLVKLLPPVPVKS